MPCKNPEDRKAYDRAYNAGRRERQREYNQAYYLKHRDRLSGRARRYYAQNRDAIAVRRRGRYRDPVRHGELRARDRQRLATDPQYRIACALRKRFTKAVRRISKRGSAVRDLGCTIEEFRAYIAASFQPGMSWENWGEWHLDHIRPLASFDLSNALECATACHFANIRPLWAADNRRKGAKVKEAEMENIPSGKDPGYFGHGVIGKERFEKEQKVVATGESRFGPGVMAVNTMGPGVTDQPKAPQDDEKKVPDEPAMLSIPKLEEALNENPALVDSFLATELTRPGGPRKGALEALEIAEQSRPDGARESVLAQIAAAIEAEG